MQLHLKNMKDYHINHAPHKKLAARSIRIEKSVANAHGKILKTCRVGCGVCAGYGYKTCLKWRSLEGGEEARTWAEGREPSSVG